MTLNNFLGQYTCISFDVIDILCIVSKQLPFVLQQANESVSWRKLFLSWKDIFSNREKYARVFTEDVNIENLLRVAQAEVFKLGVQSNIFRAKIWYPKTCRDLYKFIKTVVQQQKRG
jgi:hypothetical protein